MSTIHQLLEIPALFATNLPSQAKHIVSAQLDQTLRRRINRLNDIADDMIEDAILKVPKYTLDDILYKVICNARMQDNAKTEWSSRELRIVSYYVKSLDDDTTAFDYALNLLRRNWKDSFFNGLMFCLMNNWFEMNTACCNRLRKFVFNRLEEYNGECHRYQRLKEHCDMFEEAGPLRMALLAIQSNIKIENTPQLIGCRQVVFTMSYYSDAILKYIEKNPVKDFSSIGDILEKHQLDRTRKLALAYLVEYVDTLKSDTLQKEVVRFAKIFLGDVTLSASWSPFKGATKEDIAKLRNAKILINKWFTRRTIEVFFEYINDLERKRYWLRYVDHITDFRIVGHSEAKSELLHDNRISDIIPSHYVLTYRKRRALALVLCIKDRVFVEFSDTGWALSVYRHGHAKVKRFDIGVKQIESLDLLRLSSPNLVEKNDSLYYTFNEEGKMVHRGNWESRLDRWMQMKIIGNDSPIVTFGTDDDNVFKEEEKKEVIKYVDNIRYMMYSKYIAMKGNCRVVANNQGFYLYLGRSMRYIFIRNYKQGENPNGALIIKEQEAGWYGIFHAYGGKGNGVMVCYVKGEENNVLLKIDKDQKEYKTIKM